MFLQAMFTIASYIDIAAQYVQDRGGDSYQKVGGGGLIARLYAAEGSE